MRSRVLPLFVVLTAISACKRQAAIQGKPGVIVVDASASRTATSLGVTVFIAAEGFRVIANGSNIAPSCDGPGDGVTVPNKSGAFDYAGLTTCATKVKSARSGYTVTIVATPATKYQTVISVMDAVRKNTKGEDLFPDVSFGLPRVDPSRPSASEPASTGGRAAPAPTPSFNERPQPMAAPLPVPGGANVSGESSTEGVVVLISKTKIIVDDSEVVSVPSDAELGIEAKYKRSTRRDDFYIVPLANALRSWRERDRQVRVATNKDPSASEAIVIADASTPYQLFSEVLFTLGQSELAKFHLMVLQGAAK